ncbi:NTP transferase domain-containing protein [Actinoplanes subtropicus]|uniref:phosphocholine cytidylyltransferase family protein n=1 Tax=Actinoplanes subtropicus TaxID=543632 RepID=UPI0004C347FA|nr:phosphocholine cytidylyltransferase family protein [Actinoplanes subtropicus]
MLAIIPAAGLGSRLAPFTDTMPKALVPVDGEPLIWHTLRQLGHAGVSEAVVVTGHHRRVLEDSVRRCPERPAVRFENNADYAETNSIVSLWLTRHRWTDGFCLVDGDVVVDAALVGRLLEAGGDRLAIDVSKPYGAIDMKAAVTDGKVTGMSKSLPVGETAGEFFGVSYWSAEGATRLAEAIGRRLDAGGHRDWYEEAIVDLSATYDVRTVPADEREWAEVDSRPDLAVAERLVRRLAGRRESTDAGT